MNPRVRKWEINDQDRLQQESKVLMRPAHSSGSKRTDEIFIQSEYKKQSFLCICPSDLISRDFPMKVNPDGDKET